VESQPTLGASDDRETAQADREVKHLKKTLGRLDIVFLIVAAVVSIETLGRHPGSARKRSPGRLCSPSSSLPPTA
jgi:hypothetical protein